MNKLEFCQRGWFEYSDLNMALAAFAIKNMYGKLSYLVKQLKHNNQL